MSFEWHKKLIFACLSLQSKRRVIEKVAVTVTFQWSRCRPFPVITALRLQQHCMLETTINNIKQKFLECNTTHISLIASMLITSNCAYEPYLKENIPISFCFVQKVSLEYPFRSKFCRITNSIVLFYLNISISWAPDRLWYILSPKASVVCHLTKGYWKIAKTWHSFPLWWIRFCFGPMII